MGLRSKPPPVAEPIPQSLVAAAAKVDISHTAWKAYRLRDEHWQQDAWRFYDSIGELHYIANYLGSAMSRVRLYVAEVDDLGRIGNEVRDNPQIEALADVMFGNTAAKAEILRAIGVSFAIAGECFIVGRAARTENELDRWFVVAPNELRRGGGAMIARSGGEPIRLIPNQDIVVRLWTPHPAKMELADSPTRAALQVLAELEALTRFVFSQIDSRLAGAGMLPIPNNLDFPNSDGTPGGAASLMETMQEIATASLKGSGSASALLPLLVEMPIEAMAAMKDTPITFESVLSEQAIALRTEAIKRLAMQMDVPPEILHGAAETNHWAMWYVEESTVKIHIEPMVVRVCDALNQVFLFPALKKMGLDHRKFGYWYDVAPLTVRPNRLQDTLNLYERGIVSKNAVLEAGAYNPAVALPSEDEDGKRYLRELVLRDTSLIAFQSVREAIGVDVELPPPMLEQGGVADKPMGPPPPPANKRAVYRDTSIPMDPPSRTPPLPKQITPVAGTQASATLDLVGEPPVALVAADGMVRRALEVAGARLLTRAERGRWGDIARRELHTKIRVKDDETVTKVLFGAWDDLPDAIQGLNVNEGSMRDVLHGYCRGLLLQAIPHSREMLGLVLRHAGLIQEN